MYDRIIRCVRLIPKLKKDLTLKQALKQQEPKVKNLLHNTCRYYQGYKLLIEASLDKKPKPKVLDILIVLAVAWHHSDISKHALGMEAAKAAEVIAPYAKKFINYFIRNFNIEIPKAENCYPIWWSELLQRHYPNASEIMLAQLQKPTLDLRINTAQIKFNDYLKLLTDIKFNIIDSDRSIIEILDHIEPINLPGYDRGLFWVQNRNATLADHLIKLRSGESMIDVCAAPGGKSFGFMAQELAIEFYVNEINANRLSILKENLNRLKFSANVTNSEIKDLNGKYDLVLLDPPCSSSGTAAKNNDLKLKELDLDQMRKLQKQLLVDCLQLLKPQAKLVYITCSIFPEENNLLIKEFTQEYKMTIIHEQQILPLNGSGMYYAIMTQG